MSRDKYQFCPYPFMNEKTRVTDYEILTDQLASDCGFAASCNKDQVAKDLGVITKIIWHLNPLVRHKHNDLVMKHQHKLVAFYNYYHQNFTAFYLPVGPIEFTSISRLRGLCKQIGRMVIKHWPEQNELVATFGLLANVFHLISLSVHPNPVHFTSEIYKC